MSDIRLHAVIAQYVLPPERGPKLTNSRGRPGDMTHLETLAPIVYTTLQHSHLRQVHDLLERVFWSGINGANAHVPSVRICLIKPSVSDSLEYQPERATVVAMYKKVVIGVAIMSSPQETYITYLAVKAGWDKAQIAK